MKKIIFGVTILFLVNNILNDELICGKSQVNQEFFYQGQLKNTGLYFQLYPSVKSNKVPLLLYIAGDYGNGSAIRAFDYAGPLIWNTTNSDFNKEININSLNQNNHLLLIDFPCSYGFSFITSCPKGPPTTDLEYWSKKLAEAFLEFRQIRESGKDSCDMTQFQLTDLIIMTDGFGANLAMLLAQELMDNSTDPFKNHISLIMSDPVFNLRENFSSLDAYLEARGNFSSLGSSKTLTSMQTKFILTENVNNKDIKELINSMNNSCSRNIYDVTNNNKLIINSNTDYEIFDPVPLVKESDLTKLTQKLLQSVNGVSVKTLSYFHNTNTLLQKDT